MKKLEEILQQILKRFDGMDDKFDSIDKRFDIIDQKFDTIDQRFEAIDQKFDSIDNRLFSMDQRFDSIDNTLFSMDNRLSAVEGGQKSLLSEQSEMRKEVAFYYGSLMKKLDETKIELSSELKHVSHIQKQHQDVLEILNERQQ